MSAVIFKGREVEIENIINATLNEYPDFADAFIESAFYIDTGEQLNDDELDRLRDENFEAISEWSI